MTARAVHVAAFTGYVGGVLYAAPAAARWPWLAVAAATGAFIVALNAVQSPRSLIELRTLAVALKLALLGAATIWQAAAVPLLMTAIAGSTYASHMPGRYRYWAPGLGAPADRARDPRG
jgi:hypothetical protein